MQPMRTRAMDYMPPFLPFGCWGGWREGFFFQFVFGVESRLYTLHFPLGQWTVDFPFKLFSWGILGSLNSFIFFWVIGKSNWPIVKKNKIEWTWEAPHLTKAMQQVPTVYNGGISPGGKWWWTVLEREFSCSQWEGSACTHDGPWFFLFEWVGGEGFLIFFPCS